MVITLSITLENTASIKKHSDKLHHWQIPQTVNLLKLEQNLTLSLSQLSAFLITSEQSDEEKFNHTIDNIEYMLFSLLDDRNDSRPKYSWLVSQISTYKEKAKQLIAINKNPEQNYIGISKAADSLNPLYIQFGGVLQQLLMDELNKKEYIDIEFLSALINTRNSWYHFIMSLRVYFSTRGIQDYQKVQFYLEQNQIDMRVLSSFKTKFDFESEFVKELESIYQEYLKRLPEVLSLYKNEQWRNDIYLLKSQIYPLMTEVNKEIRTIVNESEKLTSLHIADMNFNISEQITSSKWIFVVSIMAAIGIIVVVIKNVSAIAQSLSESKEEASKNFRQAKRRSIELELTSQELKKSLEVLQATQEQLLESKKMAALGGLVAGVAHEINTPLGICVTSSSYLHTALERLNHLFLSQKMTEKDFTEFIEVAFDASNMLANNHKRAANLINSFKQIAVHQSTEEFRQFNLSGYLDEVVLGLRPKYKDKDISFDIHCPIRIELNSYPGALSQIFSHLIANSITHGFEKRHKCCIQIWASEHHEPNGNGMIEIIYKDSGIGMSSEIQDKIFEPFYTTKRNSGGGGIGMSLVYNLVTQRLNGRISLKSGINQGTQFIITFPIDLSQKNQMIT